MFSPLFRWCLFFSCWSPALLLWAVLAAVQHYAWFWVFFSFVVTSLVVLALFMKDMVAGATRASLRMTEIVERDNEVVCYGVGSLLVPLCVCPWLGWGSLLILVWIFFFLGLICTRSTLIYYNPVLRYLGFHLYEVQVEGRTGAHLLLSRDGMVAGREVTVAVFDSLLITVVS